MSEVAQTIIFIAILMFVAFAVGAGIFYEVGARWGTKDGEASMCAQFGGDYIQIYGGDWECKR